MFQEKIFNSKTDILTRILTFTFLIFHFLFAQTYKTIEKTIVSTYAGTIKGFADGKSNVAKFNGPNGICTDRFGNVYVGDDYNNCIRKVSPMGDVTLVAGGGIVGMKNGYKSSALFSGPKGVCADKSGNVYVADYGNNLIRKVTTYGVVSTYAGDGFTGYKDGPAKTARFTNPIGMAIDYTDNIYVLESGNHCIRKISPDGEVTTYAGMGGQSGFKDGYGKNARFSGPVGFCLDRYGNIYVVDAGNQCIRKVQPDGLVTTVLKHDFEGYKDSTTVKGGLKFLNNYGSSGGGICSGPKDLFYIADGGGNCVYKVDLKRKVVSTLAGTGRKGRADGEGNVASFDDPVELAMDAANNLFVADFHNHTIRKILVKEIKIYDPVVNNNTKPVVINTKYYLSGSISDENQTPLTAEILISEFDKVNNSKKVSSLATGKYNTELKDGIYNLYIQKAGYLPYQEVITFPKNKNFTHNIKLVKIKTGAKSVMRNIYFGPNSATVTIDALPGLDKMVDFLKVNPSVKIQIVGHTDKGSTYEFNLKLSTDRAKSVKDYLVQMGIAPSRIKYKGVGNTVPIADNATSEGKEKNRRIEIEILE